MFKAKYLIFCFFFIFLLNASCPIKAMEDWASLVTTPNNDLRDASTTSSQPLIHHVMGNDELNSEFEGITNRVPTTTPVRRIGAGAMAAVTALVWSTVAIPFFMEFFEVFGATRERVPPGSGGAICLNVLASLIPAVVGFSAAYEVGAGLREWVRPTFTRAFQALFWAGTVSYIVGQIESDVDWYGGALLWQWTFSMLVLFPIGVYYMCFDDAAHHTNSTPSFVCTPEERQRNGCINLIERAQTSIIDHGKISEVTSLGEELLVFQKENRHPTSIQLSGSVSHSDLSLATVEDSGETDETDEPSTLTNREKLKYLKTFEKIHAIKEKYPPSGWDSVRPEIAKWGTIPIQILGMPMKVFTFDFLSNQFWKLCTVPQNIYEWLSVTATAGASPLVILSSKEEAHVIYEELNQSLQLFKPKKGWGKNSRYWGRIPTVLARAGAISVAYTLTEFGRDIFLHRLIANGYSGTATAVAIPAGIFFYCFFAQFFDYHLTNASNWVAMGMPVGSLKLLGCFEIDKNNERRDLLEIDNRLETSKKIIRKLSPEQWKIFYGELKNLDILRPDESERLLENTL